MVEPLRVYKSRFSENIHFPMDFNDFTEHPGCITISLGLLWGQVLAILGIEGVFWFTFWSFVLTFGRLGLHFEHPGLALL